MADVCGVVRYRIGSTFAASPKLFISARKALLLLVACSLMLAANLSSAQELPNAPLSSQETELEQTFARSSPPDFIPENEGRGHIMLAVPAFKVTNQRDAPALTPEQKFSLAERKAMDPFIWMSTGLQAGMSQHHKEFPAYGQGVTGYEKRYGAAMLDVVDGGFAGSAYCVLLEEDPRYFRLGQGTIGHRVLYSFAQQASAKSDKGGRMFNWANVLGTFTSAAISNAYYPRQNRGLGLTMNRAGIGLLGGLMGELRDEFGPDVSQKIFHRGQ